MTYDEPGSMVRSEEHLEVGTVVAEYGRVRLRKVVEVVEETVVVQVRRERVVLENVSGDVVSRAAAGDIGEYVAELRDGEVVAEMVLHEERPVVTTTVVPVERVSVRIVLEDGEESVTMPVRAERVEVSEELL